MCITGVVSKSFKPLSIENKKSKPSMNKVDLSWIKIYPHDFPEAKIVMPDHQ